MAPSASQKNLGLNLLQPVYGCSPFALPLFLLPEALLDLQGHGATVELWGGGTVLVTDG